jgi:hypothetical protein
MVRLRAPLEHTWGPSRVRVCGNRWCTARGSGDPDPATLATAQGAALFLGQAAPHAGVLGGVERPLQARLANRAQRTNGFGRLDLGLCRARRPYRKEQLRVDIPAACSMAPIHLLPRFPTPATEKSVAISTRYEPGHFASTLCNAGESRRRRRELEGLRGKDLGRDTKGTPRGTPGRPMRGTPGPPRDQCSRSAPPWGRPGQSDPDGLVTHIWSFLRVVMNRNSAQWESQSLVTSVGARAETVEPYRSNHQRHHRARGAARC